MIVVGMNPICKKIADSLGLKNVKSLNLRMAHDEVVRVVVEFFPEKEVLEQVAEGLKKNYYLMEIDEKANAADKEAP